MRERVRALRDAGVEAIAVCLLHSYLNPDHERRIKEIVLEEFPEAYLSVSHEVLPLYREFERFSTVALNAYVGPRVSRYVARFDEALRDAGFAHGVQLMQSSGGMATIDGGRPAARQPAHVRPRRRAASAASGRAGWRAIDNVVTLDIGGTSADIGVAAGGELRMRHLLDTKVGDYQAMVPMVDIDTIGAGGGSIAYVDDGRRVPRRPAVRGRRSRPRLLRPRRHASRPRPTRSSLLGRLRPDRGLLGGDMHARRSTSRARRWRRSPSELGMSVEEAALGALQIQKFGMTQAIELNSVRRGYDPREFTLVAAGGAGPAVRVRHRARARDPARARPAAPGHHRGDRPAGHRPPARVRRHRAPRARRASTTRGCRAASTSSRRRPSPSSSADGVPEDRRLVRRLADCRYAGQGYEVRFDVPAGERSTTPGSTRWRRAFHARPRGRVRPPVRRGDRDHQHPRRSASAAIDELRWPEIEAGGGDPAGARTLEREVVFDVEGAPQTRT